MTLSNTVLVVDHWHAEVKESQSHPVKAGNMTKKTRTRRARLIQAILDDREQLLLEDRIVADPSKTEFDALARKSTGHLRGVVDKEGGLYIWPAEDGLHADVVPMIGLQIQDVARISIDLRPSSWGREVLISVRPDERPMVEQNRLLREALKGVSFSFA